MEDKLEQFYNSIKSNPSITGLPKDYATFKSAMADSNISAEFFKAIKQNPSITGLPEDYNIFSSALGLQKKNLIGSESTSGSEPFQDKMLGGGVKINPFQPVSVKPVEKQIVEKRTDKQLAKEVMKAEAIKGITSTPRFLYDAASLLARKTVQGQYPTAYLDYDQLRAMSRTEGAVNVLDVLDNISKTAKAESDALASKISTNKYGYVETMKSGEWGKVLDKTVNDLIVSAPAMAMIAVNPAAATAVFASAKNLDLVDNDSVPDDLKPVNAFFTGVAEVILEGKIGGTAIIKNTILNAIKEKGKEAGVEVAKKTIQKMFTDYVKKVSPEVAKEIGLAGGEEAITDISNQLTSYLTGESDKIDLNQTLDAFAGGVTGGAALKGAGTTIGVASKTVKQAMQGLNTKSKAIASDLDNPAVSPEVKKELVNEYINTNKEIADKQEKAQAAVENLTPTQQKSLDAIAVDMGNMEALLEDPNLSPETKATFQTKLDELQAKADAITSKGESIEYVSEGDNFFKILLDGTKEPVTEAEFDQAVSTPKPINEKNGDMVTVNFGGKAITGTVEVDEGGKASIYSGGVVYELPNDTEYVDYASPVRISDTDGSIEFDGVSYPEVRIESMNGTETAVLIDENGKPKTVKDPKIVEEFKYQITLANLAEITEEEAITLLSEYEQDSKTKVDDATEGGVNQADEQKRSEEDIKLQEAIDEIDLIELIALEELDNADANAKLVEYKPTNSKDTKVYLVKKNADGTVSATLDGKKVHRGAVLSSLSEAYDLQSKEGSKKLATKLQEQVNALKADVEAKLFGKAAVAETPVGDFDSYDLTPAQKKLAETYKSRITQLKESDPEQYWSVDVPSDEVIAEASKNDMITDAGGGMGIVTEDGNVIGVFKYDQSKKGTSAVILSDQAKKGAIKLDNFDTYLTKQYEKSGYRVVSRVPFNEEFAPEGWNKEAHGTPDVVMMIYDPNNQLNIKEKRFENPETGYEDAMNYRDSFVDQARENLKTQEDAIKESSQQVTQGGEQGSSVQRQGADEGQQKAGERKGDERKAEKPKADRGDSIKQSRQEQEVVFGTAFDQQEATAEETVGKNKDKWGNAQVWRERIENAGDILRELSSRGDRPDAGYLLEKVNKLKQWVVGNKKNPPDDIPLGIDTIEEFNKSYLRYSNIVDGYNYLTKFHSDVLNKIKSEYEAISTYTKEQELALNLVLDLLNNNIGGLENKLNQIEEIANSIRENKNLPIVKNITTPSNRKLEEPVKEKVTPKKDDSKPTGLSPLETKFKETPEALSKDELKEVLDTKRERYKKAMATIEKGDLEGDALKAKQKAVESLENTIEDLVKRIDAGVVQKIATKDQAIGSESIPVKNQPKTKRSLDGLKAEFSNNKVKMKVIEAVEKGISVLQSAFPSMNIVIHKSSSDFLEATGLPMINGKVPSGVFMYNGDANVGYEGTIHINLTNANPTVVYHEIAHALMLKTLGENKAMFDSFKNKVSKILSEKTAANLDAFIEPYPEFEKSEEYIVQLVAALAATKSNTNPSILMKLKVIINDLVSKITGGKITVFGEEAEGIEVYNFLKQMAETIKEGRDINTLQESFNDNLFEPTELDITGIAPDDIPASGRYPRAKEFRGDYEMVDHPIITNKILKGKPIAVTMSDHTKVGVYKNDKSGVEYSGLMGGVFYPYIKGIRNAGLGWASVTTKAARSLVANALNTDYTVVYRMARATGSIGNVNFGDIAFLELTAPVTNNKVSEKRFLSELNSQLSKVKAGVNFLEEYGVNGKVTSIASLKKGLDKMSFSARGNFWKVVMKGSWNKKSTGSWYQFLEKYNVASLEDIVNGLAETEVDTALDHDVVAVLKLAKPEYTNNGIIKIYTTRKELVNEKKGVFFIDAPNHPSYPYVVKGEPVGVLNEFNNISEYFPVIKKWIESKRLNSPYKAVETMGKELISSRISELESQLKTSKEFIKKYKDDLFSKSLGVAKTPEQMVQAMKEDIKFFNAIVDFAYLSIKLRGLKTIEAFKAELEKQLGVKFDKMPQELKDVWNEAKKRVVDEKKQAPTVKQTIKEATEQKTSPEKVATFAEYMAAKYKGMAEGEKIGQKNRFEIIKEAARYVKQAVASDVSRAKINTLINKAVNIQSFDSIKSFAKYVDKLIENQEYYAKVAELEGLAAKLGSKVKADKFGSIAPQIRRMLSINPEHLTEEGIDKYIALAKDLLSGKVADATNLESTLAQLKAEERQTIEARLTADLMDDAELISLIDTMYKLLGENPSKVLEEGLKEALPKETADDLKRALEKVNNKRAEIMEFITGDKMIKTAKDYAKLVAAVKKYNGALTQLLDAGIISSAQKLALNINPEGKDLSLLEEALKEKLDDFRKSLADQIMTTISSIKNQYLTGGIRAKLFANLSSFDKKAYEPVIKDILTIPKEVLPDLTIDQLDDLFNAVDQLSNGYISPKVMELLEVIESKGYQNSIAKNADPLYDKQVKSDGIYNSKISPFLKSISDFKSGASALADFMKTFDYKEISSFLSDGFAQIYGEYIYKPFERAFTTYKNVLEDVSMDVVKADDAIKYNKAGNTLRNVVGIFLIQADHLRNPEYKNWSEDKKNLPKYILGEYKNRKANISQKDIELLEAAMNSIEGDISTRQGLDDAMSKYFAKNPKAKNLHTAIRNSIYNNIAPMTKIAIEREGGFFDPDQDYFPIQRRGTAIQESENPFEDLSEKQYSKDFKRRANATYRRIGDPFVMRDFNATSAFNNLAEEASRNYALKPVINPYNRAIDELVARYDKEGKKDLSIFLEASKDVIHTSMKMQFQREQATRYSKFLQESMSYMRGYLLAQVWRLVPDLASNVSKAMTSMNPIEYAKYAYKQKQAFDNDSFTNLARLTSSPVIFKTSRAKMENLYSNKRIREKKLDTLAGWADVLAATTTWKALMMKNFKEITGKDLDVERLKNDADAYYLENEEALDKAAYRSDLEIDKRFVTQSEIGRAPMQKILPFLGSGENLKGYTVERTSKTFSMLNMMASYMANDARVLGAASRRLITKGDVKGFTRDVTPILLSQAVYAASISYASALASTAGYAIMSIGGDDDDEILAYFTEEINNANKIFTDPQEFAKAYAASLTMMAVGRYMAMSKIAAAFGIGIYASLDVLFAEDKKEKKEDIKKWKENFSVIKDQFYFSPITYGIKDKSIQTTGLDVLSITPVLSFYNRELEKQFTPDKSGSVLGAMKELGKKGGDDNLIGMGVLNLGMLVAIRAGAVFAPSFIKTINEANKTKARKDWEENKKKGGKSNQTKNPFGSSGFGSGGLKGGL